MDTQAQPMERDRATQAPPHTGGARERSRSVRVFACLPGGRLTVALLLCVGCAVLVGRFVLEPFEIPSGSMQPGLRAGDRVLVNRVAYRLGTKPQRGDVVVFDGTGYFGDADYIKRVVGVGGDHVVCCDSQGRIRVNGAPVAEDRYLYPGDAPSQVPFDVRVPDGTLFLLGDHRSTSSDSRNRLGAPGGGMVPLGAVLGKAEWVAWPAARWDTVGLGGGGPRTGRLPGRAATTGRQGQGVPAGPAQPPRAAAMPPGGAHG